MREADAFEQAERALTTVTSEGISFIALARKEERSAEEESCLIVLKQQMADRLLASPAAENRLR